MSGISGGTPKLDDLVAPDDNTDLNVSISAHGLTPKLPNDATKFLNGTGGYTVPAGSGASIAAPRMPGGRLTLTSVTPVTTADVTAAGTLYYTPYVSPIVWLYTGSAWAEYNVPEKSLALTLTIGKDYDVYLYDNAGTPTLELSAAWTNDTTRADALARQDGVWVKSGTPTRLYLGTIRASGTNTTEDSKTKRFVWNAYNRVNRQLLRKDTSSSWTYTSTSYQQARATAANQVEFVVGLAEDAIPLRVVGHCSPGVSNAGIVNIGIDSTTTPHADATFEAVFVTTASNFAMATATLNYVPTAGYHAAVWLEKVNVASGTTTWFGTAGVDCSIGGVIRG